MVAPHCVRLASRDMVPNYELAPPSLEVVAAPVAHLYLLTCARCSPVTRPLRTCTLRFAPFLTGDARLPERARARAVVALPDSHRRYRYAPLRTVTYRYTPLLRALQGDIFCSGIVAGAEALEPGQPPTEAMVREVAHIAAVFRQFRDMARCRRANPIHPIQSILI
jgi:hypothetical protein